MRALWLLALLLSAQLCAVERGSAEGETGAAPVPNPSVNPSVETSLQFSVVRGRLGSVGADSDRPIQPHPRRGLALRASDTAQQMLANLMRIGTVEVRGNYRLQREHLLELAGLSGAQLPWAWELSPREIQQRLLQNSWIEAVQVRSNILPYSLRLEVVEAEPWMIAEYEKHSWLVSRSGNLLQPLSTLQGADLILETTELPRLDGLDAQGDVESYLASANARFIYAVKLLKLLSSAGELPFAVERYTLLPNGGMLLQPTQSSGAPKVAVALNSFSDAERVHANLKLVLADLQKRGERASRIDLRFKHQAVVE